MTTCTVCQHGNTLTLIEINQLPVFCNVLWDTQAEAQQTKRGDIHLIFCPNCGHLFNGRFNPSLMDYTEDYENSLHYSPRFQQYAQALAQGLVERHNLHNKEIIGIGSGKGDFLKMLCELGNNHATGFDPSYGSRDAPAGRLPAERLSPQTLQQENHHSERSEESLKPNPTSTSPASPITFIQAYYNETHAHYPADFISCRHVLEHIEQPAQFMQMVRRIIGTRPTITFFEVPNTLYTLRDLGIWDLIYEHCSYFTPASLTALFQQSHFTVTRTADAFNGQFLTLEAAPAPAPTTAPIDLNSLRENALTFRQQFQRKVSQWQNKLATMAAQQQRVVIWGAGSKGVTFLNILQTAEQIHYAVDINPRKTSKFVAGTGQQIVTPDFLRDYQPHAVIIMNPNYQQEIQQQLTQLGLNATIHLA